MAVFWQNQMQEMEQGNMDFKYHQLPLARIKKIMKSDEDVKNMMISGEVPILFSKACEIFILELTLRSWIQTEENKRRTLQKMDVSSAVSKSDMYDCRKFDDSFD
ncbi:CCAAT binding transcription factor component [Gorgonomyces haynaldii]|nr:CCAAT binding transcription factor component [Gorgonomyces haynaldii]